jgi:hypothetical protein
MYVRDTALKNRTLGIELTKATISNISRPSQYQGAYFSTGRDNPYHMPTNNGGEDISWLL